MINQMSDCVRHIHTTKSTDDQLGYTIALSNGSDHAVSNLRMDFDVPDCA
jgi:hypothetical protein